MCKTKYHDHNHEHDHSKLCTEATKLYVKAYNMHLILNCCAGPCGLWTLWIFSLRKHCTVKQSARIHCSGRLGLPVRSNALLEPARSRRSRSKTLLGLASEPPIAFKTVLELTRNRQPRSKMLLWLPRSRRFRSKTLLELARSRQPRLKTLLGLLKSRRLCSKN